MKSKNKQGIPHALAWLKMIIKKTIKHQNNHYSVIPTHDHQILILQAYIDTKTWEICL
jgi:hypothetical protein